MTPSFWDALRGRLTIQQSERLSPDVLEYLQELSQRLVPLLAALPGERRLVIVEMFAHEALCHLEALERVFEERRGTPAGPATPTASGPGEPEDRTIDFGPVEWLRTTFREDAMPGGEGTPGERKKRS